jgi:hypothetical protein
VDLAQIFGAPPVMSAPDRLSPEHYDRMLEALAEVGLRPRHPETAQARLAEVRRIYEPFVGALSVHLMVSLPPWMSAERTVDDWQTSAWDHFAQWSPDKTEQITHIIADQKTKLSNRILDTHPHPKPATGASQPAHEERARAPGPA